MAETFNLPRIGDAMSEGEIVEWFVAVGDTVELDQVICTVETDKSVVEMSTPYRGTVLALGGEPGDVLTIGEALVVVGEPGESAPTTASAQPASPALAISGSRSGPASAAALRSPILRKLANDLGVDLAVVAGTGAGGRITRADVEAAAQPAPPLVRATGETNGAANSGAAATVLAMPKVRRAARERGIDLKTLVGTGCGPGGSITVADLVGAGNPSGDRRERLSAIRRSIAVHLTESAQTIPQFTSMVEVDATALLATRGALREQLDAPVPIDALFVALLLPVLREHPIINARLDGDEIVYFDRHDIGVAVDTAEGLVLPVVRTADRLGIGELAAEIVRLAAAARDRTIKPSELTGATCTVNNVGAVGIMAGTPILPLGTSTIVAFGAARPMVQLRNGNPVEVPTMTLSATFDHRLIDGGGSGRFLTQLKKHLEVPALGLL